MKLVKIIVLVGIGYLFLNQNISAQGWFWANQVTGLNNLDPKGIAIDTLNDVYVLGDFFDDISIEGTNFTSYGSKDMFLVKYDDEGNLKWARKAGSPEKDNSSAIAYDGLGAIYITGGFKDTAKFNDDIIISVNNEDIFIAKYNLNGSIEWVKNVGWGLSQNRSNSIDIDINGDIVITGFYKDSLILGDDDDTVLNNDTLVWNGTVNTFMAKYDSDGNFIKSKEFIGTNNDTRLLSVQSSSTGYYVGGLYLDSIYIDGVGIQSNGSSDVILMKFDNSWSNSWNKTFGDVGSDKCYDVSLDVNEDLYLTGSFSGSFLFDTQLITSNGGSDIFTAKYTPAGVLQWINTQGGSLSDEGLTVYAYENKVLTAGYYTDTLFWNEDTVISNPLTQSDAFVGVCTSLGAETGVISTGGNLFDKCNNMAIDDYGNAYIAGLYRSDTLFIANDTLANSDLFTGKKDVFVAKFGGCQDIDLDFIVKPTTCLGDSVGEIIVVPSIFDAPYIYNWSNAMNNDTITNLLEGTYVVTATNYFGCEYVDSTEVTHLPTLTATIGNHTMIIPCADGINGEATVSTQDGVAPYLYVWSTSASISATANDLGVGVEYVTITDICNVPIIDSVSVYHLPSLYSEITSSTPTSCLGSSDGTALVTAFNGVLPYSYEWISLNTNEEADDLASGWNYVTVTDACGTVVDSVEITSLPALQTEIVSSTPTSCLGSSNGTALVTAFNGVLPYSYEWTSLNTNEEADDLVLGWNYVTVTDACGSVIDSVEITSFPALQATIDNHTVIIPCADGDNGEATVVTQNGVQPFQFVWSTSASTSAIANDLRVGVEYVTITDICNVPIIDSVSVNHLPTLHAEITSSTPASCSGGSDGTALVIASDGVAPYTYEWTSLNTNEEADDLEVEWNFVTVTDACGTVVDSVEIISMPALTVGTVVEEIPCYQDSIATIAIVPENGAAPYTYEWINYTITDSILTYLPAGKYKFIVTDACGSVLDSVEISEPGDMSISLLPTNVSFSGNQDGSIDLIATGGTPPYIYEWSNGDISEDVENLEEGEYSVILVDINNCEISDTTEISSDVKYIEIRNAFTPNADGVNDLWNIKYIEGYPSCIVSIFNQWGILVFWSTGYNEPWDGTKNGNALPSGTYYYVIDLNDGTKVYTGSVTIIK